MKNNQAGILGMKINEICFNNQATFGNEESKDICHIPYKKNQKIPFNDEHFAVRIKRIVNGEDCLEKINSFLKEYKLKHLYIDKKNKTYYIVHDQKQNGFN
jgi:hypothetical protein